MPEVGSSARRTTKSLRPSHKSRHVVAAPDIGSHDISLVTSKLRCNKADQCNTNPCPLPLTTPLDSLTVPSFPSPSHPHRPVPVPINLRPLPQRLDQDRHRGILKVAREPEFFEVVREGGRGGGEVEGWEVLGRRLGAGLRGC